MDIEPRNYLRTEGLAVVCVVLAAYFTLGGALWLLAVLALAPDISMLGYGLKFKSGFKDTYLFSQLAPVSFLTDES